MSQAPISRLYDHAYEPGAAKTSFEVCIMCQRHETWLWLWNISEWISINIQNGWAGSEQTGMIYLLHLALH